MRMGFKDLSLQWKMTVVFVISSLMILAVNLSILIGINMMSSKLESTYEVNLYLNDMSKALSDVQSSMTEYLNVKSSDALEQYYICDANLRNLTSTLRSEISSSGYELMQRNIRNMTYKYLDVVSETIEAKRGRNVDKYRQRYESATELYGYTSDYITSLNNRQFSDNSETYGELSKNLSRMENTSVVVMVAFIVLNALIIINYAGRITSPLRNLAKSADEVAKGNFDISLPEARSRDEIGVVTTAFNQMVRSIRDYVRQVKENMESERRHKEKELLMETHLKDAQLKYLQAQINPHFLFNTLNAGAQLAMMEGADRTYEFVQNMSEFFRYNVKMSDRIITLREELDLVDHYIFIINVRFAGDIVFEKDIDESLLGVSIPSMILQPIVENAVNHGVRDCGHKGVIKLTVKRFEDNCVVSIRDNGVGMTEEDIRKVFSGEFKKETSSMDSNGVGLDNVIGRLRVFLDGDDVMSIVSEGENKGTEFIIYLPLKENDDV